MPPGFSTADLVLLLPELIVMGGAVVVLVVDMAVHGGPERLRPERGAEPPSESERGWGPASPERSGRVGSSRTERALTWLTLGVLLGAGLALTAGSGAHATVARGLIAVDGFAVFFKLLFLVGSTLTVLMSSRYFETERARPGEYYFLVLCATLGMMILAGAIDLITIFVGLETMAVSFYVLAGFVKWSRRSNEAGIKYFLLGTFSLAILLYGMSLLYGLSGTTQLRSIATAIAASDGGPMLTLAVLLLIAGLGFKIAAVPFHMWAPDVYEGAPTPVTAFLSVGSKAASFAMLLRIFVEGLPAFHAGGLGIVSGQPLGWGAFLNVVAIASMTLGNLAALTQSNIKRLLAYSSVAHAGYVLMGVVAGTPRGVTAALIYLMVYVFMQAGAFAVVVALRRRDAIGEDIRDLSGLYASQPAAAVAMLLFLMSLGGIPPTAGFMGKLWLFGAALDAGYFWLAVIGVANSALSLYYYVRVVVSMWISEPEGPRAPLALPMPLGAALVVTAAATLLLGLYPDPLFELAASSAASLGATPAVGLR